MQPRAILCLLSALSLAVGCAKDFDQFDPLPAAATSSGATSAQSSGAGNAGTGGAPTSSSTTGNGAASSSAAGGAASVAASSATSASVASSSGNGGTGGSVENGGGGSGPVLNCDGAPCDVGEVCCHGGNSPNNDTCGEPGSCGDNSEITCAGPANCPPGQICCGTFGGPNGIDGTTCQATCDEVIYCAGDPSVCMGGDTCMPSMILGPGYEFCG